MHVKEVHLQNTTKLYILINVSEVYIALFHDVIYFYLSKWIRQIGDIEQSLPD